ncbi:MAG: carbohydrate kinase [Methylophilaceae bacterium 17-44-8]|nr:MAG: carbohydrate kinase [Methylophilales bacterium 28-44-11]OYY84364.1 MAG: carbohydrate kinase [Methylophilales bacterium 16-45-9]OZA06571.1 MAG: carbohydrate kinase [Methylophilaceae bacterium 17-44-8]
MGGAPFNVARHLNAFDFHPVLITRTGQDALKDELLQEMNAKNMDTKGVQHDPVYPTGQVKVTLTQGNASYDILPDQAYDFIHAGMTHMITMSIKPEITYFGTLAQRGVKSRLALDQFLSDGKSPRFLDINLRKPWYNKHTISRSLKRADIVKLNEDELAIVAQTFSIAGQDLQAKAIALIKQFQLQEVIVTCGAEGAWTINHEGILTHVKAHAMLEMVDTVGAGDAFAAVYIVGLLKGWTVEDRLTRANAFASAICGVRGAVPEDLTFYQPFKQAWQI